MKRPSGPGHQRRTGMGEAIDDGFTRSRLEFVAEADGSLRANVLKEGGGVQFFQNCGFKLAEVKQNVVVEGQAFAYNIQESVQIVVAPVNIQPGQYRHLAPDFFGRSEPVQTIVAHSHQPDILQILVQAAMRGLQVQQGGKAQIVPVFSIRIALPPKPARLPAIARQHARRLHSLVQPQPQIGANRQRNSGLAQGVVQRPPKLNAVLQAVKVGGLQRGILPVIAEGNELALLGR